MASDPAMAGILEPLVLQPDYRDVSAPQTELLAHRSPMRQPVFRDLPPPGFDAAHGPCAVNPMGSLAGAAAGWNNPMAAPRGLLGGGGITGEMPSSSAGFGGLGSGPNWPQIASGESISTDLDVLAEQAGVFRGESPVQEGIIAPATGSEPVVEDRDDGEATVSEDGSVCDEDLDGFLDDLHGRGA